MARSACAHLQADGPMLPGAGLIDVAQAEMVHKAGKMQKASSASADIEDVRRCLRGDGDAYRRLIERYQGRISTMMWRFSRDPETHADLVQDVFVEAYGSLSSYRGTAPFEHWLSRLATHVGYQHWKRQKREDVLQTVPLEDWHELPEESPGELDPTEAAERLHRLLERLPPRDRLVLTLRYVEDRSVEETAALTGWSQTMVKVQTWRAKKKLKALFARASGGSSHE
jgi:RNA polymerase sigma-70 factor (ECF subfamily)